MQAGLGAPPQAPHDPPAEAPLPAHGQEPSACELHGLAEAAAAAECPATPGKAAAPATAIPVTRLARDDVCQVPWNILPLPTDCYSVKASVKECVHQVAGGRRALSEERCSSERAGKRPKGGGKGRARRKTAGIPSPRRGSKQQPWVYVVGPPCPTLLRAVAVPGCLCVPRCGAHAAGLTIRHCGHRARAP